MSREALLDLLEGAARYLDGLAGPDGARVCPEHGVEHLGKTAYRVHLGLVLSRERGASPDVVRETALHLARRCRKYPHPEARAHLFFDRWPDPWNCSNHLIDSGAACDALGRALIEAPELFDADERELVAGALERCATTYLWAASIDKPVPAQCLWGALGMARAAAALGREDLRERTRAALDHAYECLRADGSWSYYPSGGEPGSDDASSYYHSRCIGFALESLLVLGDDPRREPHRGRLERALEFLLALHRADGTKSRAWEAKLWYFDGPFETASLPFDVHALALGHRVFGDPRTASRAARSLERLTDAVGPDGSVGAGSARAFQCRTFWTAHLGLLGEVLRDAPALDAAPEPVRADGITLFADAGLARLDSKSRVVLVRGRRSAPSPGFGGEAGGGAVVSDSRPESGERVRRVPLAAEAPGELLVPGYGSWLGPTPERRRTALHWLRFSRWRWRCALRADGAASAAGLVRRTLGEVRAWWRTDAASHFALDAELEVEGSLLRVRGGLAAVDGTPLPGVRVSRAYRLAGEGLRVEERLDSERPLPRLAYRVPAGARDLQVDGEPCAKTRIERRGATRLELRYLLP